MSAFDCIVIGGGGMGSAAAFQLARSGSRVLVLEQFSAVHDRGSSHGETRAIRKAYFEHPDYVPLLRRAYELWSELEQISGKPLYCETGLLLSGPPDGDVIRGARLASATHGVPLIDLDRRALGHYPGFCFPDQHEVVMEPEAGYLLVERCVRACLDAAVEQGCELREREPVMDWRSDGFTVSVRTSQAVYAAESLVLAGGAWSAALLGTLLPLQILRKTLAWHGIRQGADASRYQNGPVFLFEMPEGVFYGFPSTDGASVKLAEHSGGSEVGHPDELDRTWTPADSASVASFVDRVMPGLHAAPLRGTVCMYTMTPDQHFIVDQHPEFANVSYAAGFSGHGFKFAPVIGELLADRVLKRNVVMNAGFLQLGERFS